MPIYSYKCEDCGAQFDLLIGVGRGNEELQCHKCGSKKLKRLLSSFGVRIEGSSSDSLSCPTGTCPLSSEED
ncbi:MAG TPA: zinc ribbon domain-containing protein [bacterium (Candidatus Stahlbacteria)]|nr:zinc ribbon domain-containing protein [Candidatus Stahlbacteria bacterium]